MQTTHQQSDAQLVQSYKDGNTHALEVLINRYKDKIYTAIYMLVKDQFTAEDIFQDTFLKIIRTIKGGRYSEQGKFLPWAMRVAHNLCMDHFRKVRQNVSVTLSDGTDITELLAGHEDNASTRIEKNQTHQAIRDLIEQLPEEQREVIILRIYADLSFKQIAKLTSVSINTALGRMRYGLINLRRMVEEKSMVLR